MEDESGTLKLGEFHPSAHIAMEYIRNHLLHDENPFLLLESIASCALSGNRLAEVVHETLRRVLKSEPVSDRYLMGAAWFLWSMENNK